jgi:hypothetical protein
VPRSECGCESLQLGGGTHGGYSGRWTPRQRCAPTTYTERVRASRTARHSTCAACGVWGDVGIPSCQGPCPLFCEPRMPTGAVRWSRRTLRAAWLSCPPTHTHPFSPWPLAAAVLPSFVCWRFLSLARVFVCICVRARTRGGRPSARRCCHLFWPPRVFQLNLMLSPLPRCARVCVGVGVCAALYCTGLV